MQKAILSSSAAESTTTPLSGRQVQHGGQDAATEECLPFVFREVGCSHDLATATLTHLEGGSVLPPPERSPLTGPLVYFPPVALNSASSSGEGQRRRVSSPRVGMAAGRSNTKLSNWVAQLQLGSDTVPVDRFRTSPSSTTHLLFFVLCLGS